MENVTKSPTTQLKKPTPTSFADLVADMKAWTEEEILWCKKKYGCQLVYQNANAVQLSDKSLPNDCLKVSYEVDGVILYDLTRSSKRVQVFDMSWDKFREGLKSIDWGPGRVNPKLWGAEPPKSKSKK